MKHSTRPNNSNYHNWRNAVLERDKNICQRCKIVGRKIHAHHIIEWDKNEDLRYEVNNGLTLCTSCHNKHHHIGKESKLKGIPLSEETKKKLSEKLKGMKAWNKGQKGCFNEETKEKMREAKLGKKASEETKKKMSFAHKNQIYTIERNRKISASKKGIKFTDEHKKKLRDAKLGRKLSESHKAALLEARTPENIEANKIRLKGKKWKIDPETNKRIWY